MENIYLKAEKYAEGKAYEAITKVIAEAYAEGFKDGYKTREEEIPVDLRDNKTEYVDLGLPSGTLWATDYEKVDDKIEYKPYSGTSNYKLPTEEQWEELKKYCKWEFRFKNVGYTNNYVISIANCIGPNGNILSFSPTGIMQASSILDMHEIYFWILDDEENLEKKSAKIYKYKDPNKRAFTEISKQFSGYRLPIRLVR